MKKKNAFTLVELIAVLALLAILATIVVPTVNSTIRKARNQLYEDQLITIKEAARLWGAKNIYSLPDEDAESVTISLLQLKLSGFLDYDIKNPLTDSLFPDDMQIVITRSGQSYIYDVLTDTGSTNEKIDADAPLITLNGGIVQEVEINTPYQELGASAQSKGAVSLPVTITKEKNGVPINTIDTSTLGVYTVIYTASDGEKTSSIKRTVYVIDTLPPVLTCQECTSNEIELESNKDYILPTVTATDNSTTQPLTVTKSGSFSPIIPGEKIVTYQAVDESGNVGTLELIFHVKDTLPPTLEVTSTVNPTTKVTTLTVTASDTGTGLDSYAYSFDGGASFQMSASAVFNKIATINVVVRDKAGNTNTKTVSITENAIN